MSVRKTLVDTISISFVSVIRLLAQFIAIPILSRILSPADYGVVAMALPFVFFAMMLADAGIGISLVRTPISDRHVWSTCFWISVVLGAVLSVIMIAGAPFFSLLFEEPRLQPIVMALAVVVFLQSFFAIPGAALQQAQKFKLLATIEVSATAIGIAVAVIVATHGGGPWALVFQQLIFYGIRAIFNFWCSSFRPLWIFDIRSVKEHLIFGRNILSTNFIGFFSQYSDSLIIGKVLAAAAVGMYSMAFQFARLPFMLVSGPLQYVFYAKLLRVREDREAICNSFLVLTRILAILIFPAVWMVAVTHQTVFVLLLSEKWAESGRIFMLVAAASSLNAVMGICGTIRMVLGRTDLQLRIALEQGGVWLVTLLIVVSQGLDWVALGYSAISILYAPRQLMLVLPLIGCSLKTYAHAIMVPAIVTAISIIIFLIVQNLLQLGDIMQIVMAMIFVITSMVISGMTQRVALVTEFNVMNAKMNANLLS